eukprot:TRINITY_DN23814_c0_g1_i4.p1 TRINITY_DN23814_c0_g1~~TRINITY_DN23814_c0_g1_i4.p1  ORF type:complete len:832 (-),score=167.00 TRINITY_DN23814_c0_g1_i4:41-2536(-)
MSASGLVSPLSLSQREVLGNALVSAQPVSTASGLGAFPGAFRSASIGIPGTSGLSAGSAATVGEPKHVSLIRAIRARLEGRGETPTDFFRAHATAGQGFISRDDFVSSLSLLELGVGHLELVDLFQFVVAGTGRDVALIGEVVMAMDLATLDGSQSLANPGGAMSAGKIQEAERVLDRVRATVGRSGRSFEEVFRGFCRSGGGLQGVMTRSDLARVLSTFEPDIQPEVVSRLWRAVVSEHAAGLDYHTFCTWFCPQGKNPSLLTMLGNVPAASPSASLAETQVLSSLLEMSGTTSPKASLTPQAAALAAWQPLSPRPTSASTGALPSTSAPLALAAAASFPTYGNLTAPTSPVLGQARPLLGVGSAQALSATIDVSDITEEMVNATTTFCRQAAAACAEVCVARLRRLQMQYQQTGGALELSLLQAPSTPFASSSTALPGKPLRREEMPLIAYLNRLARHFSAKGTTASSALVLYHEPLERALVRERFVQACEDQLFPISRTEAEALFHRLARPAEGIRPAKLTFDDLEAAIKSLPSELKEDTWAKDLMVAIDKNAKGRGAALDAVFAAMGREAIDATEMQATLARYATLSSAQWDSLVPLLDKKPDGSIPWRPVLQWAGLVPATAQAAAVAKAPVAAAAVVPTVPAVATATAVVPAVAAAKAVVPAVAATAASPSPPVASAVAVAATPVPPAAVAAVPAAPAVPAASAVVPTVPAATAVSSPPLPGAPAPPGVPSATAVKPVVPPVGAPVATAIATKPATPVAPLKPTVPPVGGAKPVVPPVGGVLAPPKALGVAGTPMPPTPPRLPTRVQSAMSCFSSSLLNLCKPYHP